MCEVPKVQWAKTKYIHISEGSEEIAQIPLGV